ncbi:hypothetical protein HK098_008268 [Nowakowskiella sp. JEL0407]|nr:hypothetical protein HK098_008268 [Nowakowskiella sp. JEL0407]
MEESSIKYDVTEAGTGNSESAKVDNSVSKEVEDIYRQALEHFTGIDTDHSIRKAIDLFKKAADTSHYAQLAADKNNSLGMEVLGYCYFEGQGVERNPSKAVELFRKAIDTSNDVGLEYSESYLYLGHCYKFGIGLSSNSELANDCYYKAVASILRKVNDSVHFSYLLGTCYYNGFGVAKDYKNAVKWYSRAADEGNPFAQNSLGDCFNNGYGVKKNYHEAMKWYRKAADVRVSNEENRFFALEETLTEEGSSSENDFESSTFGVNMTPQSIQRNSKSEHVFPRSRRSHVPDAFASAPSVSSLDNQPSSDDTSSKPRLPTLYTIANTDKATSRYSVPLSIPSHISSEEFRFSRTDNDDAHSKATLPTLYTIVNTDKASSRYSFPPSNSTNRVRFSVASSEFEESNPDYFLASEFSGTLTSQFTLLKHVAKNDDLHSKGTQIVNEYYNLLEIPSPLSPLNSPSNHSKTCDDQPDNLPPTQVHFENATDNSKSSPASLPLALSVSPSNPSANGDDILPKRIASDLSPPSTPSNKSTKGDDIQVADVKSSHLAPPISPSNNYARNDDIQPGRTSDYHNNANTLKIIPSLTPPSSPSNHSTKSEDINSNGTDIVNNNTTLLQIPSHLAPPSTPSNISAKRDDYYSALLYKSLPRPNQKSPLSQTFWTEYACLTSVAISRTVELLKLNGIKQNTTLMKELMISIEKNKQFEVLEVRNRTNIRLEPILKAIDEKLNKM